MRISLRAIAFVMLFVILYTGFQGGRYFLSNRIQEIGLLFALTLFVSGAVLSALLVKQANLRWSWWVGATLIFLIYTVILPAQRFSANTGVSIVPSLFASREFLMAMLCPALYFLYRLGFSVEDIEKVFIATLVALILSYVFHYKRMDLEAAYFSSDHAIAGLVTFDPWRGYRLKTPSVAFYLLTILTPIFVFISKEWFGKLLWLGMFFLLIYIWVLVSHRSALATLIAAVFAYHLFFSKKSHLALFFTALPFGIFAIVIGVNEAIDHLSKLDPETDGVRYKSGAIALQSFLNTPFFGFGQQSNHTLTEQTIFWYKFYSSDLGIVGILFKYGVIGASVYTVFSYYLIRRMIITNWMIRRRYGKFNPTIFSLLIVYLAFTINIILIPVFTYISGITAAAFGIALTSIWRHKLMADQSQT